MSEDLRLEERAANNETYQHISRVRNLLNLVVSELLRRGELHDQSKLKQPEVAIFAEYAPKLAGSTYGSEEYKIFLQEMKLALDHHYAHNPHHPEHHQRGINDMTLVDLVEMLCDWKASTERHDDGDIQKSIEINTGRFGLSEQVKAILKNTVKALWPVVTT